MTEHMTDSEEHVGWEVHRISGRVSQRHRSRSPAGSVDSLDDVIQRLDMASTSKTLAFTAPSILMLDSEVESLPENAARPVKATADHSVRTTKSQGNGQDNFREEHRDTSAIEISLHRLNQKELAQTDRCSRSLSIQRDLSWVSPRKMPVRKSMSRRGSKSPSKNRGRRFHDAQSDIGYSGPTHLQMPTNWSGWFYAGDSTFLSAMYFLSGVENTKASAEMCYILESPERRRKMIEDAEEQVLKDTGSSVSKSALQKDKNGSGQKGTYTANSSKGLDVEAAMMKLLQRGYTDEQIMRHFTVDAFHLTLPQIRAFRASTGIQQAGSWIEGIGRVGYCSSGSKLLRSKRHASLYQTSQAPNDSDGPLLRVLASPDS